MELEKSDIEKFHDECNWAFKCWRVYRLLYDDNQDKINTIQKASSFFELVHHLLVEYVFLQVSKLHDAKKIGGRFNLSIDFLTKDLTPEHSYSEIYESKSKLESFYKSIQSARNRRISHIDYKTIFSDEDKGEFPEGLDIEYFQELQVFVDLLSSSKGISLPTFDDLIDNDVDDFLDIIRCSLGRREHDEYISLAQKKN